MTPVAGDLTHRQQCVPSPLKINTKTRKLKSKIFSGEPEETEIKNSTSKAKIQLVPKRKFDSDKFEKINKGYANCASKNINFLCEKMRECPLENQQKINFFDEFHKNENINKTIIFPDESEKIKVQNKPTLNRQSLDSKMLAKILSVKKRKKGFMQILCFC